MVNWASLDDSAAYGRQVLRGNKVLLRRLREEDLATLAGWWADPEITVLQQESVQPRPDAAVAEMFRQWSANSDPGSTGFSIATLDADDLVGHVALYGANVRSRWATLGIIIGPDHTGRGYGTDALDVMVRYGFEEMGLHRIELRAWAYNNRAIAAYSKVGFVEEGRRRDVVFHAGSFHDEVLMAILEPEWRRSDDTTADQGPTGS